MFDFIKNFVPKKLLEPGYIFEVSPSAEGLYRFLAILFGLMILLAFILIIKAKKQEEIFKKLYSKIINLLLFSGFFGLVLLFFRFEGIPYLGSRLLMLILFVVAFVWFLLICYYKFRILPREIENFKKQKIFEKYLP